MKFSKFLNKIIVTSVIFSILFTNTAQALTAITADNRTTEVIVNITKSGEPSDLPVASVSDFFDKENIHLLQNFDLSAYTGKKVFVGYGLYDTKEENCKFIEKPGLSKLDYEANFPKNANFNQHSYAISKVRIPYSSCKALGTQFGGYPVAIDSAAENMFLAGTFTKTTINSNLVDSIWVGAKRTSCDTPLYTNEIAMNQNYEKWKTEAMGNICEASKLNVKADKDGSWSKTSETLPAYCVIEFENTDYTKPLKMCAPWWKVIREYPNKQPGLYNTEELKRINQADIPIQVLVCTKYDTNTTTTPLEERITRTAHCTDYYSRTVAPECVRDMKQAQCKVDECGGYIKNVCRLKASEIVGKGYVKGEVLLNGVITEVKVKDEVTTHEYECPPSPPSSNNCIEESAVVIYPKECPGSQCDALKACTLAAKSSKDAIDICYANHPCTKIYGGRDIPPVIDPVTREVTFLKGKCPDAPISDGSILDFPVNIEKKMSRVCEEYEMITEEKQIIQQCKLERPFTDYEVDMSITETDDYENNPLCIRMDTVIQSLEMKTITMKITNNGFFRNKLSKMFLDDSVETVFDGGMDIYMLGGAMPMVDGFGIIPGETNSTISSTDTNNTTNINLDCSAFNPYLTTADETSGTITNPWNIKNYGVFVKDPVTELFDPNITIIDYSGAKGLIEISDNVINNSTDCSQYAADISSRWTGTNSTATVKTYSKSLVGVDTCILEIPKVGIDSALTSIQPINTDGMKYTFTGSMSKLDCTKKAFCLDGYYNENDFTSSPSAICEVTNGGASGSPTAYLDAIKAAAGIFPPPPPPVETDSLNKNTYIPTPTLETASSTLNGVENIFMVEEYLRGGWGYYSNYNMWDPISNSIKVSTAQITDFNLLIPEMSKITDYLDYHAILTHESHKAKKPDIAAAAVGGLAVGAAFYAVGAYSAGVAAITAASGAAAAASASTATILSTGAALGPVGWAVVVVVVVFIILLVLLGKSKSMDRQHTEYHVYKDIHNDFWEMGPYETRFHNATTPAGWQSSNTPENGSFHRLTYWHNKNDTGRHERADFMKALSSAYKQKQRLMLEGGVELSEIDRMAHPDEISINYGYPACKWYKPSCEKMDIHKAEVVTNGQLISENTPTTSVNILGWGALTTKEKIHKKMSTVYLGAVNTLVVLVPYQGDYEFKAFNKYDTLLSTRVIHESSFAGLNTSQDLKSAQVNFALGMNLAPGIVDGLNKDACIKDRAVEWGGGVSGVFFETQRTEESKSCQKSVNGYVKDQSMTSIFVKPLNMDRGFTYQLTKPMPFPNRVWVATLDNREIRNYRCFEDWPDCGDTEFKEAK